jgi:cytoskeletal protein RodZ
MPQSIGELLKKTREYHGLRMEDIAGVLCIQKKNLEYLEQNAFSRIPEKLYRELFLKTYSTYLGLHWDRVQKQYYDECGIYTDTYLLREEPHARKYHIRNTSLWVAPKIIQNSFLALGMCGGLVYVVFLGWSAFQPPHLVIFQPHAEFSLSSSDQVRVSGQTKKEAHVAINGQVVVKKQDGTFAQDIALSNGLNIITITVSKKFSRHMSMTRKVLLEKHPQVLGYSPVHKNY